jgi:hypothetical protein
LISPRSAIAYGRESHYNIDSTEPVIYTGGSTKICYYILLPPNNRRTVYFCRRWKLIYKCAAEIVQICKFIISPVKKSKSADRKMEWANRYVNTWLILWFTVFNMLVVYVSLQLFQQKSCLFIRFCRSGGAKTAACRPKDENTKLVDPITLSIYFIKIFGIHGNNFTCRTINLKTRGM